jgi:hypothetical protein
VGPLQSRLLQVTEEFGKQLQQLQQLSVRLSGTMEHHGRVLYEERAVMRTQRGDLQEVSLTKVVEPA